MLKLPNVAEQKQLFMMDFVMLCSPLLFSFLRRLFSLSDRSFFFVGTVWIRILLQQRADSYYIVNLQPIDMWVRVRADNNTGFLWWLWEKREGESWNLPPPYGGVKKNTIYFKGGGTCKCSVVATKIICTPTPTSPLVINKDQFLSTKPIIPDGDNAQIRRIWHRSWTFSCPSFCMKMIPLIVDNVEQGY